MTSAGRIGWKAVRVLGTGASTDAAQPAQLVGNERLAALYRFQSAGRSPGHRFYAADVKRETEIVEPDQVDWSGFPVIAALEAVTYDELRRLRMLLTESGEYETPKARAQATAHPPTPPHGIAGLVGGVDLRRGSARSDV